MTPEIAELVLRLAKESPTWSYDRNHGAVTNLGHRISDTTVANILKARGIEPAPDRGPQSTWRSFLEAHWEVLASLDFTTIEVWTRRGLVTCYLLFLMEVATRRVHFAGLTANPDEEWMLQVARNVTDAEEGFMRGKKYLWIDRDAKFQEALRVTLGLGGRGVAIAAAVSECAGAHRKIHGEREGVSLPRLIFFGEAALVNAVREFVSHFHQERSYQGLGNRLIEPGEGGGRTSGKIVCRERLGGLLRYYYREAA